MCIGTTSINTRTFLSSNEHFRLQCRHGPRDANDRASPSSESTVSMMLTSTRPLLLVAVETEEIVSTVVTTSIRRGRARSSKRQRFEKEGDRLVEKPIENPVDAATRNPEGDINEQDVRAYLGYPDADDTAPDGSDPVDDDNIDDEDILPAFGPRLTLDESVPAPPRRG